MPTRTLAGLVAGVAAALMLTACGPKLESGEVVARDHSSAWCSTSNVLIGKAMLPQTTCHPESWSIELRGCDSGECNLYTRSVSQNEYEACRVGDHYPECVTGKPSQGA